MRQSPDFAGLHEERATHETQNLCIVQSGLYDTLPCANRTRKSLDFHLRDVSGDGQVENKLPLWRHMEGEPALALARNVKRFFDGCYPPSTGRSAHSASLVGSAGAIRPPLTDSELIAETDCGISCAVYRARKCFRPNTRPFYSHFLHLLDVAPLRNAHHVTKPRPNNESRQSLSRA
jgi:hypothetical protein